MEKALISQIVFFTICLLIILGFIIFISIKHDDRINYSEYIKLIEKQNKENLNTLKSGNKKINELEKKILSYRKKLKSKNIM